MKALSLSRDELHGNQDVSDVLISGSARLIALLRLRSISAASHMRIATNRFPWFSVREAGSRVSGLVTLYAGLWHNKTLQHIPANYSQGH